MRKLHKKYIELNVFLIIYIMSLSVGYAYFSESIQARGTAKTLSYYTQPLVPLGGAETGNIGDDNFAFLRGNQIIYKSTTSSSSKYYIYYDIKASTSGLADIYLYFDNSTGVNITDFTATLYDTNSILVANTSGYSDSATYSDGFGYVEFYRNFNSSALTAVGTTKQFYIRVNYKSQGATRTMYFYYYFNIV